MSKWGNGPRFIHNINDCPYDPQDLHYYARPSITGSTLLCSAGSAYTIVNLPSECSISWSTSGNISRYSAQGSNPCTFQAYGSGDGWIEATITSSVESIVLPRKNLWVGTAQVQSVSGPSTTTRNAYNYYYANTNHSSGTTYNWMVSPSGPYVSPSGGEVNSCLVIFYTTGYYTVLARAVNACGTTTWSGKSVYVSGGKSLSLFPNPASDNVTLTIKDDPQLLPADSVAVEPDINQSGIEEPTNYTVRIYNSQSSLLSTVKRSGITFSIPLNNMKDGTYIIEVSNGKTSYTQQLIVKN